MNQLTCFLAVAALAASLAVVPRAALARLPFSPAPVPAESFEVGTLHVNKFGSSGHSLILIPGLSAGTWTWFGTIGKFSSSHTIYAITLPGFDGRTATKEKPLFTAFMRDFWILLEKRHINSPVVIGHSLGGTLGIGLAEEHPERLAGVVAADGLPVFPMVADATAQQRGAIATQMGTMYASFSKADQLAAVKDFMGSIGTNKPELVEPTARLESRSDPKAVAAWLQETLTSDLRPNLKKCTIPLLEIMPFDPADAKGFFARSQQQTLDFYKSLVAAAPKATVVTITPSRHFVMLDQPEAFYKAVGEYLSALHR